MKIAWICSFTDSEIQQIVKPYRRVKESAPWISMLLKVFEGRPEIDLTIISPHQYISGIRRFDRNGIHYFFFNSYIPLLGRHWPSFFRWDLWTDFSHNKRVIYNIIEQVKPDIIHLHGFENAYYSSAILKFKKKYPVFITVQGFVSNYPIESISNSNTRKRRLVEQRIITEFSNFGIRTKAMGDDVLKLNPAAILHWHRYNIILKNYPEPLKKYDIVLFARSPQGKGLQDLIQALGIIKNKFNIRYSLVVIGSVDNRSKSNMMLIAANYDVTSSITFLGYLETRDDVQRHALEARICVLPTKNDIIPGTIVESMALGIPVISYDVGSIGELNDDDEYILLVQVNDIEGLAKEIHRLLEDITLQKKLAEKAKKRVSRLLDNDSVYPDLIECYKSSIKHYMKENE